MAPRLSRERTERTNKHSWQCCRASFRQRLPYSRTLSSSAACRCVRKGYRRCVCVCVISATTATTTTTAAATETGARVYLHFRAKCMRSCFAVTSLDVGPSERIGARFRAIRPCNRPCTHFLPCQRTHTHTRAQISFCVRLGFRSSRGYCPKF